MSTAALTTSARTHPVPSGGDDGELVRSACSGDSDAFAVLIRRYQNALYRYGMVIGLDHDTSLDLVQDTFIKAFTSLTQCRDASHFRSWLFRIFRNATLDWRKNIRRREVSLEHTHELADSQDLAERLALRDTLGAALAGLPPLLREAFLLRHHLEYSYEEIAEVSGASVSAVKMRVLRAREALRTVLHPDYGNVTLAGPQSS